MNDGGEVAGGSRTANDEQFHAFFWRNGVITDIGTVGDDTCSTAHFMNNRGQVSGTSGDCLGQFETHGFLWQAGGPMIDLNVFVPPGVDIQITDGETINDAGEIAGSGMLPNGDFHAIVLIPCNDTSATCRSVELSVAPPAPHSNSTKALDQLTRRQFLAELRSDYLRHTPQARWRATNRLFQPRSR